jgi:hypothetical protein
MGVSGVGVGVGVTPFCVTARVLLIVALSTVIVAVRLEVDVFSSTLTVTLPSPLPDVGLTLHQFLSLDTAQAVLDLILNILLPLPDVNSISLTLSETCSDAPF